METFRFRRFKVYQDAKSYNVQLFQLTKNFPLNLRSQIIRSSLSILLNIAEGSAKKSDKDFNRYIENSLGSVNETIAGLELAYELKLLSQVEFLGLLKQSEEIAKQLGGLSKKLKSR